VNRAVEWLVSVALVAALPGCASTLKETFARPPKALGSDPGATALVVVDCFLKRGSWGGGETLLVHGAHLRGGSDASADLFEPVFRVKFEDMGILFEGLSPGHYQLMEIVGTTMVYNANMKQQVTQLVGCNVSRAPDLAFEAAPGSLVYFGRFSARVHGHKVDTEWYRDPNRELKVWKAIRAHYSPSPWDKTLDRRIAYLADSLAGSR
jgi:hypothetical protein